MQAAMKNIFTATNTLPCVSTISYVPVRFRYHANRKPILFRRWGYEDKLEFRGLLPRDNSDIRVPMPEYRPKNPWRESSALFGQNDYVDILGDPKLHPILISYNVPAWLRGFKGGEYQTMVRKKNYFAPMLRRANPGTYNTLMKNIKYQYNFLRHNQPQNLKPQGYSKER